MLICHCRAINDRVIRETIAAGARRPEELADGCGAGTRCGGCIPTLLALLNEEAPGPTPRTPQPTAA